jgi:hypothetical protein
LLTKIVIGAPVEIYAEVRVVTPVIGVVTPVVPPHFPKIVGQPTNANSILELSDADIV